MLVVVVRLEVLLVSIELLVSLVSCGVLTDGRAG